MGWASEREKGIRALLADLNCPDLAEFVRVAKLVHKERVERNLTDFLGPEERKEIHDEPTSS